MTVINNKSSIILQYLEKHNNYVDNPSVINGLELKKNEDK